MQIILYVKEEMKKNNIPEPVVIGIVWSSVMSTVEWNKKEELVAEQAIKHLKVSLTSPFFGSRFKNKYMFKSSIGLKFVVCF